MEQQTNGPQTLGDAFRQHFKAVKQTVIDGDSNIQKWAQAILDDRLLTMESNSLLQQTDHMDEFAQNCDRYLVYVREYVKAIDEQYIFFKRHVGNVQLFVMDLKKKLGFLKRIIRLQTNFNQRCLGSPFIFPMHILVRLNGGEVKMMSELEEYYLCLDKTLGTMTAYASKCKMIKTEFDIWIHYVWFNSKIC